MILIDISGANAIVRKQDTLTSGMVGATAVFRFDEAWEDLSKIAVFRAGNVTKDVYIEGSTAEIPHEVLDAHGYALEVGVYGTGNNGTVVIPTIWAKTNPIKPGADPSGDESADPSIPIWGQLLEKVDSVPVSIQRNENRIIALEASDADNKQKIADLENAIADETLRIDALGVSVEESKQKTIELASALEEEQVRIDNLETGVGGDNLRINQLEAAVEDIIAELNYKEIDITKFTNSAAGTHEIGSIIGTVTLTWELNKAPASQTLNGASLDATARSKEFKSVSTAQTYTLNVKDERGATDAASSAINFYNGVYYGVLTDGAEINSAAVLTMTRKLQSGKGVTFTANAGSGNRHAYALPRGYGTPTFKDAETGFQAGFYLAKTFEFTNGSGYTEEYNVWLSTHPALGSMTVAVS